MRTGACRFCGTALKETFVDLGVSPLANSYVSPERLNQVEAFYPLHAYVCSCCYLVQLEPFESPERIFGEYLYFSSFSDTWLAHCRAYASDMIRRFNLGPRSQVVEIASNDGYLLQYFKDSGIPVLGIEPAANIARAAIDKGIPTEVAFFGTITADALKTRGTQPDLIVANNVLAHVPDLNDFVRGLSKLLKPHGVITVECPHVLCLIADRQFDTIYHEHFSYFSLLVLEKVFAAHGLRVFDVTRLATHGGSLRLYACHDGAFAVEARVRELVDREHEAGLTNIETYRRFAADVRRTKCEILGFFVEACRSGRRVAGYGAPAKGNTLLNYCGIGPELMPFTVDRSPHKQGLYLPGRRIPIREPNAILETRPDYVFILPWNLQDEVIEQMSAVRTWGGRFVIPIPELRIV